MLFPLLLAGVILLALLARWLGRPGQRCPECGLRRDNDTPICPCGWVFETPETEDDLDYAGDEEDEEEGGARKSF
jgi:hypothetical protein